MLEEISYLVGIVGGISSAVIYVLGMRKKAIDSTRQIIARAWTNEGDISSTESIFVTLELENSEGDLIGSISSNAYNRIFEAHADVGWFSTKLYISELLGRNVLPIATVTLKVTGNNNRLKWCINKGADKSILKWTPLSRQKIA